MCDAMAHRGPDAQGHWEAEPDAEGWGPMLGHRRLAILDLTDAGVQPMTDRPSGNVVVLNGEVYNFLELRKVLGPEGHGLGSTGDTAVLARLLSVRGEQGVSLLRGMFAFAFWHAQERELWLARDALGIKPLYLITNDDPNGDWTVAFASEVRALLASGLMRSRRLDGPSVASFVWNGFTVAPRSIVQGIESMLPGEMRVFGGRGRGRERKRRRHWTCSSVDSPAAPRATEAELASALHESVRLHLSSDVPLAVFLSGGVDSSAIANLAHRASSTPIHTFTLAFEEIAHSEGGHARRVAEAIGTRHQEVVLTHREFVDNLDPALDSLDQPSFDGINTYYMSRAVAAAGFKVALVGSGGDELFGGYTSFRDLPLLLRWKRATGWLPREWQARAAEAVLAAAHRAEEPLPRQTRLAKLPDMLRAPADMAALYQLAYALFRPETHRQLLAEPFRGLLRDGLNDGMRQLVDDEGHGRTPLSAIGALEQRLFLGERLLRDADATSMASSIEMRLPLVDQELVALVHRLPDAVRFGRIRSKEILRRVGLKGLDPALFDRPKAGFELPYEVWLKGRLGQALEDTLMDESSVRAAGLEPAMVGRVWRGWRSGQAGLYWSRVWGLFALVRWCRRHGVSA